MAIVFSKKPVITQTMQTRCLLLTNMFDPAEYVLIRGRSIPN